MKTIKPQKLSLLCKVFEHDHEPYLVVTILALFPFDAPSNLLPEATLWELAAAELGKDAALDVGMPKPGGELVITGEAYAPGGTPCPAFPVRATLGAIDKTLYVVGDRHWKRGVPSAPVPLTRMPLLYANAFGGPGYALNPLGKGFVPPDDGGLHPLPNLEDPKALLQSPRDRPPPAGFGSYDFMWPQRSSRLGTYDDAWFKERFPGFPDDMDLSAFNTAPEDQRIDEFFREDEAFTLENLHPDKPRLASTLPGIAARCFIHQKSPGGALFQEIAMRLETVHLFPRAERGIVLFRGLTRVLDEDADDVLQIVLGAERMGAPKPVEHYRKVLDQRLDKARGYLFALRDGDLLPPPAPDAGPAAEDATSTSEMASLLAREGLIERHARRRAELELARARERLRSLGLDPDVHIPRSLPEEAPTPDLEDLPDVLERTAALADQKRSEAERQRAAAEQQARKVCEEQRLDYDTIVLEHRKKAGGPPRFSAEGHIAHLKDTVQLATNAGVELPHVDAQLADPELRSRLEAVETKLRETYVKFAQYFPAAAPLDEAETRRRRQEVTTGRDAGQSFEGRDFTGADLSGLDLRNADFRGALLESVDLSGSDLSGADFSDAVLARADLTRANLSKAKLSGANLGMAKLTGANVGAGGVDLSRAVLTRADLTGADLTGARLAGADLSEAVFKNTTLRGISAPGLTFFGSDLSGLKLSGATMSKCNFLEVTLRGANFSDADLTSAVFVGAKGDGAVFRDANLENLRCINDSSFEEADFQGASLDRATLRGTRLARSDFTSARMNGADLSGCDLRGARVYRVVARDARFVKADLTGATLVSANLMHALLQKATVHGADFRGANLFRADLFRVRIDGATTMAGAELTDIRFVDVERQHG